MYSILILTRIRPKAFMFPTFDIYSTPLLILSLQGLIFTLLLLKRFSTKRNYSDLFLALILLITCYHQTTYTLGFMSWYDTFRTTKINYYLISLSLALAPLLYFYFRSITNPKKGFSKKDGYHFIPVVLLIVIRLIILFYDSNQAGFNDVQNGYLVINFQWKYLDPFVTLLSMLQMLIYLMLSFQALWFYKEKITHFFSNTYNIELKWLTSFWFIYAVFFMYYSVQTVINAVVVDLSWLQEWWYYMLSGLVIIYVGIKGYFTDLSKLKGLEIETFLEQKDISFLKKDENQEQEVLSPRLITLKKDIEIYFETHQPYLEPDLTLITLSKKLNLSREELSEAINKGFNLKFNDFINQYRVDAFKHKISEGLQQQLSLLGVAYECGFNSKATFNRAFKKFTTKSPTEYLKTIK